MNLSDCVALVGRGELGKTFHQITQECALYPHNIAAAPQEWHYIISLLQLQSQGYSARKLSTLCTPQTKYHTSYPIHAAGRVKHTILLDSVRQMDAISFFSGVRRPFVSSNNLSYPSAVYSPCFIKEMSSCYCFLPLTSATHSYNLFSHSCLCCLLKDSSERLRCRFILNSLEQRHTVPYNMVRLIGTVDKT
ncbi:uncharacterized protein LOC131068323 isoform X2 [Cryptomeria japonica]|uniref:uncharacterized protein LOC131068323 isoform X2 n=1 Tax=Cryptomeria japonica TaxID=3369 RepID=UPI0027DA8371|nr:uncharacterized protein LOC131068323 isoform X2 [Cryptomeria japonica]